jgi:hypothetical protein
MLGALDVTGCCARNAVLREPGRDIDRLSGGTWVE